MLFSALEFLKPQNDHSFFKELTQIIADFQTEVDKDIEEHYAEATALVKVSYYVYSFKNLKLGEKLSECIKKHTNLTTHIGCNVSIYPNAGVWTNFKVDGKFKAVWLDDIFGIKSQKPRTPKETVVRLSSLFKTSSLSKSSKTRESLLTNGFDRENGKLFESVSELVSSKIYLTAGLLAHRWLDVETEQPSRGDWVAAVLLHEVGHTLSTVNRVGDFIHKSYLIHDLIDTPDQGALSKDTIKDCLGLLRQYYKDNPTKGSRVLLSSLSNYEKELSANDTEETRLAATLVVRQAMLWMVSDIGSTYLGELSDTNEPMVEREADQYATLMGAGGADVEYTKFVHTLHDTKVQVMPSHMSTSKTLFFPCIALVFLSIFKIRRCAASENYDSDKKRMRLVITQMYRAANDESLDKEARQAYLDNIKMAEAAYNEYESLMSIRLRESLFSIYKTFTRVGLAKGWPTLLFEMSKPGQLHTYLESLINSSVHRDTGRLKMILDKKKSSDTVENK